MKNEEQPRLDEIRSLSDLMRVIAQLDYPEVIIVPGDVYNILWERVQGNARHETYLFVHGTRILPPVRKKVTIDLSNYDFKKKEGL